MSKLIKLQHEVISAVGRERLEQLHKPVFLADLLTVVLVIVAPYLIVACLYNFRLSAVAVLLLSLFQGWLIVLGALVAHEIAIHRRVFSPFWNKLLAALLFLPTTQRATRYSNNHRAHHQYVNTAKDPEIYKKQLVGSKRRIIFSTIFGFIFFKLTKSTVEDVASQDTDHQILDSKEDRKWLANERFLQIVLASLVVILGFFSPHAFVFGVLLPLVLWAPVINTIRVVGDHAVVDTSNEYWLSTLYPSSYFSVLFLYESGEFHQIHHIFPKIPFYRMPSALRAMKPTFVQMGLNEERSLMRLLILWFAGRFEHGTAWRKNETR